MTRKTWPAGRVKIVTIEDPIEFLFEEKLADIAQREVGVDCPSFHVGARDAWRQNPDVISIAERRQPQECRQGRPPEMKSGFVRKAQGAPERASASRRTNP